MNIDLSLLISISKKMRILYVEDNKEARVQTIKMLQNYFADITVAKNGQEGLDSFKNGYFHIVFTDIEMPVMDGITMISHIREIDCDVPIVVLSAYDKKEYFIDTINSGIDGYILKPYDAKKIVQLITKIALKFDIDVKSKNRILLIENFTWEKERSVLIKKDEIIKLTKSEVKLFEILSKLPKGITKVETIESYVFNDVSYDSARVRKLVSRLKSKLGIVLIESNYAYGYSLKTI